MYSYGFAERLYERATEAANARYRVVTESTKALAKVGHGSLAQVLRQNQKLAETWLRDVKGVRLSKASGGGGYSSGSHDAFSAGRSDGGRAEFSAKRAPKLTGQ
jgi:hypothetical protein